ncbi:hypothetical protein [Luteococcus peritonei]|uniref:Tryptophan-associated transmembrane protein n=1 Tax=Luteococcus peritonei TaxID=88874 RepID=A0ABW4RYJ9_9ACTN
MTPGRQKLLAWPAIFLAAVTCLGLASRSGAQADVARALGWAMLGGLGVSLLLGALGRRLVAALVAALAAGVAALVVRGEGHPGLWAAVVLAEVGALAQLVWAGGWSAASRFDRSVPAGPPATDLDVWKALDAGLDPTADEFGDNLPPRETRPAGTHQRPDDRGAHQEDQ